MCALHFASLHRVGLETACADMGEREELFASADLINLALIKTTAKETSRSQMAEAHSADNHSPRAHQMQ